MLERSSCDAEAPGTRWQSVFNCRPTVFKCRLGGEVGAAPFTPPFTRRGL